MTAHDIGRRSVGAVLFSLACLLAAGGASAGVSRPAAQAARDGKAEVAALLSEFLSKVDSAAMHERFWADDLIYVGNTGVVRTKADILKGMKPDAPAAPPPAGAAAPDARAGGYAAEDVTIRQFGEVVVLNFRLVQRTGSGPDTVFRNSGMFVLRGGRWQAVSWQATRVPPASPAR